MNQKPLVSIITVSFNSEKYISDTFESVFNQNYSNFEYILIDGGSTDNTLKIAKEYKDKTDQHFHIVSEKDNGIYDAMNKGIKMSTGDLVCIINSDDFYEVNALELYVKCYLNNQNRDDVIIVGNANMIDVKGNIRFPRFNTEKILDDGIEFTMPLTHPAYCVHKNVYDKIIGNYNTNYKIIADYDFTFKAYKSKKVKFLFINEFTVNMREGGVSDNLNLSLILDRTVSRFLVRKNHQNLVYNFYLCSKFFSEELLRQFFKKYFKKSKLLKTNRKIK